MKPELDHLSYSAITAYLICPKSWWFKYVRKEPTVKTPELAFGTAFHGTVEAYLTAKTLSTGAVPDLIETWLSRWQKETAEGGIDWGIDTPEPHANNGVRMLGDSGIRTAIDALRIGCDVQGPRIERKIELHVPGVPIPIIGYIDAIDAAGVPIDFKTSGRAWTQDKAAGETQSLFYLAALNQAGQHSHNWHFQHLIFVKTKQPQAQSFVHIHAPGEVFWLFELVRSVWDGMQAETYFPNPTGWKCSPQYCDFWSKCRGRHIGG